MLAKFPLVAGLFCVIFAGMRLFGTDGLPLETGWRLIDVPLWLSVALLCLLATAGCGWIGQRLAAPGETAGPPADNDAAAQ